MRALFIIIILSLSACGSSVPQINAEPEIVEIEIIKFKFVPENITIKPGTIVRWVNKERIQYHSVLFEEMGGPESDYLFPGQIYEQTFAEEGDFPYRCGPHPRMTGSVSVKN